MTNPHPDPAPDLLLAFAPLHKAAFGAAVGAAGALLVFAATAVVLVRHQEAAMPLELMAQYFAGYSESWRGAFIGAGWAAVAGFAFGWFTAFCRNFAMAVALFVIRTRADLAATRDFLDHV